MTNGAKRRSGPAVRVIRGAAIPLAMALLISACGGSGSPSKSAAEHPTTTVATGAVVLASARTTARAGSARIAISVTAGGSDAAAFALTAEGLADFKTGNSQLTMHFGGAVAGLISGDLEVRSVDGVAYVQLPPTLRSVLGRLGADKPWLAIDASKIKGNQTVVPGVGESDPTRFLAYLETVSDDVTKVGTEKVRGVDTTHYHATFDLAKAVDQERVPQSLRDALAKLKATNGVGADLPTIPADIFLDAQGRLRRLSMQLDLASFAAGIGGGSGRAGSIPTVTTTIEMYEFGVPVHVTKPPADQVGELPMLGAGSFGGFGSGKKPAAAASSTQE
jgi:hypothetical protein